MNIGGAAVANLTATLSTSDTYVSIIDNTGQYGSLGIDSTKENTGDPFVVQANAGAPHGYLVDYTMVCTGDGGFADTMEFGICIGDPVPFDTGRYYAYYSGCANPLAPVYQWMSIDTTQITNPGVSLDLLDNQTVTVDLPFTFMYYGVNYTQISVCSNGWIAMGSQTDIDATNTRIPNPDGPQAMIAGIWDDLDAGNSGEPGDVYYYYDAANHRFIVEFFMVEHWPVGSYETFEFILCDPVYYPTPTGDGDIYVQYLVVPQTDDITVGIENSSETIGIEYFYSGAYHPSAAPITNEFAIRYTTWPPELGIEEEYEYTFERFQAVLAVYPSVANGPVTIQYFIAGLQSDTDIKIYDATGSCVRSLEMSRETGSVQWDRKDRAGNQLANGIYFVTTENQNQRVTTKVIFVE